MQLVAALPLAESCPKTAKNNCKSFLNTKEPRYDELKLF